MFPDGILGPILFQLPIVKYGPPPTFIPTPEPPKYGPPLPFTPSPLPSFIPTPTPDPRGMLVLPILAVASIVFIIFMIACAVLGFLWLSKRGRDKK
jgi:hypothetical protein